MAQVPRKRCSRRGLWGQRPQESGARTCAAPEGGAGSGLAPRGGGAEGSPGGAGCSARPPPSTPGLVRGRDLASSWAALSHCIAGPCPGCRGNQTRSPRSRRKVNHLCRAGGMGGTRLCARGGEGGLAPSAAGLGSHPGCHARGGGARRGGLGMSEAGASCIRAARSPPGSSPGPGRRRPSRDARFGRARRQITSPRSTPRLRLVPRVLWHSVTTGDSASSLNASSLDVQSNYRLFSSSAVTPQYTQELSLVNTFRTGFFCGLLFMRQNKRFKNKQTKPLVIHNHCRKIR